MKLKASRFYFLGLIGWALLSLFVVHSAEIDPHHLVKIPLFKGSYNLQEYVDASNETESVTYRVQTNHPPTEVLEFYDAYFNGEGWRSSFEICQRNWEALGDRTKTAKPIARQLFASWEHAELNLRAVLWLHYEMADNQRQNEVVVKCQIQPKTEK